MRKLWLAIAAAVLAGSAMAGPTLKDAYKDMFLVGTAVGPSQVGGRDGVGQTVALTQFNALTPGNELKWEVVHPRANGYNFGPGDAFVAFALSHGMHPVGHVLLWHNQTPSWVFYDGTGSPRSREALLEMLHDHIKTVVGRYKGKIKSWDVVNEAIDEDGKVRQSLWYQLAGGDYIAKAFQWAHEADPEAELIYNDYNIEYPAKRAGALALVKYLKSQGVPITTVGIQGHYLIGEPDLKLLDDTIAAFDALGVKVAITELDVDVLPRPAGGVTGDIALRLKGDPQYDPYRGGLPPEIQAKLAERYAKIFAIARKHKAVVNRVTLWGVTDADSWHNNWPIRGRTAHSLLFDRDGNPKPAFAAVIEAAQ